MRVAGAAAVAAQSLAAESGIPSRTVAQWLWRIDNRDRLAGIDVLVLDEAASRATATGLDRVVDDGRDTEPLTVHVRTAAGEGRITARAVVGEFDGVSVPRPSNSSWDPVTTSSPRTPPSPVPAAVGRTLRPPEYV